MKHCMKCGSQALDRLCCLVAEQNKWVAVWCQVRHGDTTSECGCGNVFGRVCMSVCVFPVRALTFESFDLKSSFLLLSRYIFRISRSFRVKVIGSRSRSQEQKPVYTSTCTSLTISTHSRVVRLSLKDNLVICTGMVKMLVTKMAAAHKIWQSFKRQIPNYKNTKTCIPALHSTWLQCSEQSDKNYRDVDSHRPLDLMDCLLLQGLTLTDEDSSTILK